MTQVKGYCEWFLELLSPTVTKGHGLQKMCLELGISLEENLYLRKRYSNNGTELSQRLLVFRNS